MKVLFLVENTESKTAINLINALKKTGHCVDIIAYFEGGRNQCSLLKEDGQLTLCYKSKKYLPSDYDGAFLWCWGTATLGRSYLRTFEDHGVTVLNSTYHTEITDSKVKLAKLFQGGSVRMPRTICFETGANLNTIYNLEDTLGPAPYVFKPNYGTQGAGVCFVSAIDEIKQLAESLRFKYSNDYGFILQELIGNPCQPICHFRVLVIGEDIVPTAIKATASKLMNVSNISDGANICLLYTSPSPRDRG